MAQDVWNRHLVCSVPHQVYIWFAYHTIAVCQCYRGHSTVTRHVLIRLMQLTVRCHVQLLVHGTHSALVTVMKLAFTDHQHCHNVSTVSSCAWQILCLWNSLLKHLLSTISFSHFIMICLQLCLTLRSWNDLGYFWCRYLALSLKLKLKSCAS